MPEEVFFDSCKAGSKIKTEIVRKYFTAWASVISSPQNVDKIAYIDLFSGPGQYSDGTESTPIQILRSALSHKTLPSILVTVFNDINKQHASQLKEAIAKLPNSKNLKYQPEINNEKVGEQIAERLKGYKLVPTLLFVDPFGYMGLTIELIGSVLKDWGCDCIFFFNYNRINAGITNPKIIDHIDGLFGKAIADDLRLQVKNLSPEKREGIIIDALKESLKKIKGNFVQTFKFYDDTGTRTSHFIIFVSKNIMGYKLMKSIMAPLSSKIIEGISYYEFNPNPSPIPSQLPLFQPESQFEIFKEDLLTRFSGQTKKMVDIFEEHNINTAYIESNYKEALLSLEQENRIVAMPSAAERPMRLGKKTFGPNVCVKFP